MNQLNPGDHPRPKAQPELPLITGKLAPAEYAGRLRAIDNGNGFFPMSEAEADVITVLSVNDADISDNANPVQRLLDQRVMIGRQKGIEPRVSVRMQMDQLVDFVDDAEERTRTLEYVRRMLEERPLGPTLPFSELFSPESWQDSEDVKTGLLAAADYLAIDRYTDEDIPADELAPLTLSRDIDSSLHGALIQDQLGPLNSTSLGSLLRNAENAAARGGMYMAERVVQGYYAHPFAQTERAHRVVNAAALVK